jgi:hypothetical protein
MLVYRAIVKESTASLLRADHSVLLKLSAAQVREEMLALPEGERVAIIHREDGTGGRALLLVLLTMLLLMLLLLLLTILLTILLLLMLLLILLLMLLLTLLLLVKLRALLCALLSRLSLVF